MYDLKGFIEVDGLENSSPTVVAKIGELSPKSRTYAKGVGEYTSAPLLYKLSAFSSTTANGPSAVPAALQTQIWTIVKWMFDLQTSGAPAATAPDLVLKLTQQFGSVASSIGCGALINAGTFRFPEYVTWVNPTLVTSDPSVGGSVKLWFADDSFKAQYPGYTIVMVPPVAALDDLLGGFEAVKTTIANYTESQRINAVQTARGEYPETLLVPVSYDFVDPTNSGNTVSTTWVAIIYGAAGNNIDLIRAAVQDYILENSLRPVADWRNKYPQIYTSTEFLLFPRWKDIAIPNLTLQQGLYSGIVSLNKQLEYLKLTLQATHTAEYIDSNAETLPTNYKSLQLVVVPGTDNPVTSTRLAQVFPDYTGVPSTDSLFNQMSGKTRGWINMMANLLILAETFNAQSVPPSGVSRTVRGSVLFLIQEYSGVQYLVATKNSTPDYS